MIMKNIRGNIFYRLLFVANTKPFVMGGCLSLLFFFFAAMPIRLAAQVLPKDGSSLHYRIIGFSFPADKKATDYKIEIAQGYY